MADRFWVGGTGNWNDTAHWSTTSGGASGAAVPTSSDNVIFDTASSTANAAYTATVNATANCLDFTMDGPDPADATKVTWAGSSALNIYGSMNLSGGTAGITRTYTGNITFKSTTTGKTLTTNSVVMSSTLAFDGVGGGWTLQDNFNTGTRGISLINGSLDLNGKTVTCGVFGSNNSNTRTLTCGASNVNFLGLSFDSTTNLTFNANTSNWTASALNSTCIIGAMTWNNLSITGAAAKTLLISASGNFSVNGTLTINGNSSVNRLLVSSSVKGTARTITAATVSVTNTDFQDITGAGAGSWDLSSITGNSGDCGGNSGITFTTPVTTDCSAGTTWSTATWSSRVPLPQDTATFSGSSRTITQDMPCIGSVNFTGSSGLTWTTSTACSVFGSINLTDLGTLTASTQAYTFEGRGSNTITSAGKNWGKQITITAPGGSVSLSDDYLATANANLGIAISDGTFNTNSHNVTISGTFYSLYTTTRVINLGSSILDLRRVNTTTITLGTPASGLTFNAGTSTIKTTGTLTANVTLDLGGNTLNNFWINNTGAFSVTIASSNTFNDFKIDAGRTVKFTAGTTQTVSTFTAVGTAGNLITIDSSTTATHAITKTGGGTISCDYLSVQHSVASPANTWYAGTNSTNNQAVATAGSGWIFTAPPPPPTAEFLMFF